MLRDDVHTAVVWRTGALGDFVLTLPVLDGIRARSSRLVLIAPSRYRPLWRRADRWIDADGPEATALYAGAPLEADVGVAWTSGAADALAEAGVRRVWRGQPMPPPGVHQVDNLWEPVRPWLGERYQGPRLDLEPVPRAGPVVIAPGSGGRTKRWPIARWSRIAAALPEVVWVAGPLEQAEADWGPGLRVCPSLDELVALARTCRAWLGPDSGPQHVAAAAGAPVGVGFTEVTDPRQWAPVGARVFPEDVDDQTVIDWVKRQPTR